MKYFFPKSQFNLPLYVWLGYTIIVLTAVVSGILNESFDVYVILFLFLLFIIFLFVTKISKKCGVYIKNDKIYVSGCFTEKEIDIESINGIVITKSTHFFRSIGYFNLKDKGHQLYSIILLKEIIPSMSKHENGDLRFCKEYRKSVIAMCRYDKNLVGFLRKMNPSIEVL